MGLNGRYQRKSQELWKEWLVSVEVSSLFCLSLPRSLDFNFLVSGVFGRDDVTLRSSSEMVVRFFLSKGTVNAPSFNKFFFESNFDTRLGVVKLSASVVLL